MTINAKIVYNNSIRIAKMKKLLFLLVIFSGIVIIACSTAYKNLVAEMPDLASKPDGVYRGEYDLSSAPTYVMLDVTVQNRQITKIDLIKHKRSPIGKKAEKITEEIIKAQRLDVDVVSGATASSKAILKAVENALQ